MTKLKKTHPKQTSCTWQSQVSTPDTTQPSVGHREGMNQQTLVPSFPSSRPCDGWGVGGGSSRRIFQVLLWISWWEYGNPNLLGQLHILRVMRFSKRKQECHEEGERWLPKEEKWPFSEDLMEGQNLQWNVWNTFLLYILGQYLNILTLIWAEQRGSRLQGLLRSWVSLCTFYLGRLWDRLTWHSPNLFPLPNTELNLHFPAFFPVTHRQLSEF